MPGTKWGQFVPQDRFFVLPGTNEGCFVPGERMFVLLGTNEGSFVPKAVVGRYSLIPIDAKTERDSFSMRHICLPEELKSK